MRLGFRLDPMVENSRCPVCIGDMTIDAAFTRYVASDMSDVEVMNIDDFCCDEHWDMLMDAIKKYDEEQGLDDWGWPNGEEF